MASHVPSRWSRRAGAALCSAALLWAGVFLGAPAHADTGESTDVAEAVTISEHPKAQSVVAGTATSFTAAATGTPEPSVIWQESRDRGETWLDMRAETRTTLSLAGSEVSPGLNGRQYRAVFTNEGSPDGVATDAAVLTVKPKDGAGAGKASIELSPELANPAANVGGTIRMTGEGWLDVSGAGGSLIALKLNAGGYLHKGNRSARLFDAEVGKETGLCPATLCRSNKSIWYVIAAADDGTFDVDIPLPNRNNTMPGFAEGSYTFQLLTRAVAADDYYQGTAPPRRPLDPSRTMVSDELTVVAEGQPLDKVSLGKPTASAEPLHVSKDLTKSRRGGVEVTQRRKKWAVTVPAAEPDAWVYANVYEGASPRFPWAGEWFKVDARKRITLPVAKQTLPIGTNKLSVQDRNGGLLGWASVTVAAESDDVGDEPGPPPHRDRGHAPVPTVDTSHSAPAAQPSTDPAKPVASYADLVRGNAGSLTATEKDGTTTVTFSALEGGSWVHLFVYTETGRIVGVGWVQVGTDQAVAIDTGSLPDGSHKLAFVDAEGELVGWVGADGPSPLDGAAPVAAPTPDLASAQATASTLLAAGVAPGRGAGLWDWTLSALAVLVLASATAGAIRVRSARIA